jgi:hypothetical protein
MSPIYQLDTDKEQELATECFRNSDTGRRPHILSHEGEFYVLFKKGYNIALSYLQKTNDYDAFKNWFSVLNPLHIASILDDIERSDMREPDLYRMIEDTLIKQLQLLGKWLDYDPKAFVEYWGHQRIFDLLELVDDNIFFDVLRKLSSLNPDQEVDKILSFYANDDETHIREFAKTLLVNRASVV